MPSHFSTIRISGASDEHVRAAIEESILIEVDHGVYLRWGAESGAQIWMQLVRNGELVGPIRTSMVDLW